MYCAKQRLKGSDPASWVYVGRGYSVDIRHVYYGDCELAGVAPADFSVVNLPTLGNYATIGARWFHNHNEISREEFWQKLDEQLGQFRQWLTMRLE